MNDEISKSEDQEGWRRHAFRLAGTPLRVGVSIGVQACFVLLFSWRLGLSVDAIIPLVIFCVIVPSSHISALHFVLKQLGSE